MNERRKEYTLLWFIENYSYWGEKHWLVSPTFHTDGLEGIDWLLRIIPRGISASLVLCRWKDDNPEDLPLTFQFSLLAADGSAHHSAEFKHTFGKSGEYIDDRFMPTDELFVRRRAEYLPNGTLTVCCKMWTGEGDVLKAGRISARTRPITEKLSFYHVVEKFSSLEPDVKKTIQIRSHSNETVVFLNGKKICTREPDVKETIQLRSHLNGTVVLSFNLSLVRDAYGEKQILIENVSTDLSDTVLKYEFFLKDVIGYLANCGAIAAGINNQKLLILPFKKQLIPDYEWIYLPDDELSLLCECTFFTGLHSDKIEETIHELPSNASSQKRKVSDRKSIDSASEMMKTELPGVPEDMKALYNEQYLTDVQLKTKTKSFAAHKLVLCARSPVFKEMLTNDMKEKITDCIQVDDLEDDTVQQLLIFLYSDCLEPLQWRSATQLYYAAHKYAVRKLQEMCSTFLVENITPSNASELLLLADVHRDSSLKEIVEGFILENDEQVFGSSE